MKDIEEQPKWKENLDVTHRLSLRTHKANWVGKVDKRTLYLTFEKSTNHISLAIGTHKCSGGEKKKSPK